MERYSGGKSKCDFCGRAFSPEEPILLDSVRNLIFCLPEDGSELAGCMVKWVFRYSETASCRSVIFAGVPKKETLPEYGGAKNHCDGCGQEFSYGDQVFCDLMRQMIFCWHPDGRCIIRWKEEHQLEAVIEPAKMRFHGNT